ncbi:MAG: ABC transporter permease [Dehalococcoidia bacterium]|nr:MAG: ABC transporter permease [Dehalococcoidia bacterium]
MTQTYPPLAPQERRLAPPSFAWWVDAILLLAVVAAAYGIVAVAARWTAPMTPEVEIDLSPSALPSYAGLSTLRMALAYLLSLTFSLVYGRLAATGRLTERVLVPLLDILQSIPILSFLPGVVLGLVALFPNSNLGLELAAILLIFTSQSWNMAFSVYQSVRTIPEELREVAFIYRLNAWQRFTRLELPFGLIPLVWNSMMSWAGGWFFLMAAEQFTLGEKGFQLPGLGSYLRTAADAGDVGALALGLGTLIATILLLDQLLWRPLIAWADRFKVEQTAGGQAPSSFVLAMLQRSVLLTWLARHVLRPTGYWFDRLMSRLLPASPATLAPGPKARQSFSGRRVVAVLVGAGLLIGIGWGAAAAGQLLAQVTPEAWAAIATGTAATFLRVGAALALGAAWTVPLGVAIGLNPRWAQPAQPLVQMVASIPATALFPALLLILLGLPGSLNLAAIALMLLGTQWYLLFNVIAGAMAIPNDLREAARIYRLTGWRRWRLLILPGIFPSLVTGMITASGGAWNASIVSEYISFNQQTFQTVGLGAVIAQSAAAGDFAVLLAATLTMAAVVVAVNRLLWRRLYHLAEQRFRLE